MSRKENNRFLCALDKVVVDSTLSLSLSLLLLQPKNKNIVIIVTSTIKQTISHQKVCDFVLSFCLLAFEHVVFLSRLVVCSIVTLNATQNNNDELSLVSLHYRRTTIDFVVCASRTRIETQLVAQEERSHHHHRRAAVFFLGSLLAT